MRREIVKRLYSFCCCLKFVYANTICPRDAARTHKNWKLLNVKDSVCIFFMGIFCENEKCPLQELSLLFVQFTYCFVYISGWIHLFHILVSYHIYWCKIHPNGIFSCLSSSEPSNPLSEITTP